MTEDSGRTRALLAGMVLLALIAINLVLIYKTPTDDFTKTQLNTLNGALILQLGIVMAFYFGTSSGAKTLQAAQTETTKAAVQNQHEVAVAALKTGNALDKATPTGTADDPVTVTETAPAARAAPAAAPAPVDVDIPFATEDPRLTRFRQHMRLANQSATEEQVLAAFRVIYPDA